MHLDARSAQSRRGACTPMPIGIGMVPEQAGTWREDEDKTGLPTPVACTAWLQEELSLSDCPLAGFLDLGEEEQQTSGTEMLTCMSCMPKMDSGRCKLCYTHCEVAALLEGTVHNLCPGILVGNEKTGVPEREFCGRMRCTATTCHSPDTCGLCHCEDVVIGPDDDEGDVDQCCPGKSVTNEETGESEIVFCGKTTRCRHYLGGNCHSGNGCKFCHCGEPDNSASRPELNLKGPVRWRYYLNLILRQNTEDPRSILARLDALLATRLVCVDCQAARHLLTLAFTRLCDDERIAHQVVQRMHRVFEPDPPRESNPCTVPCTCAEPNAPQGLHLSVRLPCPPYLDLDTLEEEPRLRHTVATALRGHADAGLRALLERKDNKAKLPCLLENKEVREGDKDDASERWSLVAGFQFKPSWLKGVLNKLLYWIAFLEVTTYWPSGVDRTLYPLRDPCNGDASDGPHLLTPYIQRALKLVTEKANELKEEERKKAEMKENGCNGAQGKRSGKKKARPNKKKTKSASALTEDTTPGEHPDTSMGVDASSEEEDTMSYLQQELDRYRAEAAVGASQNTARGRAKTACKQQQCRSSCCKVKVVQAIAPSIHWEQRASVFLNQWHVQMYRCATHPVGTHQLVRSI
mmetsp:Transcript_9409/g.17049  ORF Transcript_9409/g.17049 Transcript_9409/m.17049 type:complete len:634 (+) Transcript_9409:68-1969(+)